MNSRCLNRLLPALFYVSLAASLAGCSDATDGGWGTVVGAGMGSAAGSTLSARQNWDAIAVVPAAALVGAGLGNGLESLLGGAEYYQTEISYPPERRPDLSSRSYEAQLRLNALYEQEERTQGWHDTYPALPSSSPRPNGGGSSAPPLYQE